MTEVVDLKARKDISAVDKAHTETATLLASHAHLDEDRFSQLRESVSDLGTDVRDMSVKMSSSAGALHTKIDTFKTGIFRGVLATVISVLISAGGIVWALLQYQITHP